MDRPGIHFFVFGVAEGFHVDLDEITTKQPIDASTFRLYRLLIRTVLRCSSLFSGSLFDENKFIIVNQVTDKILKILEILIEKEKQLDNIVILFNANILEKKSKLRSIFEKELVCVEENLSVLKCLNTIKTQAEEITRIHYNRHKTLIT